MTTERLPDYQDLVKHKFNDVVGTVIAIYQWANGTYLDVRTDERVYYHSNIINWSVAQEVDE